jgi:hypothetical protein
MATKAEMIKAAVLAQFGSERQLTKTFTNWQGIGLLGMQTRKSSRRGGEGHWHPRQLEIWLWLLQNRASGVRLVTLSNAPVGLWLLGADGIDLRQAQRAFGWWANRMIKAPLGDDSLRGRSTEVQVERLAGGHDNPRARQRLRRNFELLSDDAISPETFAKSVLDVMTPGREATAAQRWVAQSTYRLLSLRFRALSHIELLVSDTPEVRAFWEWARRMVQASWKDYGQTWLQMHAHPEIGYLFERPETAEFVNGGCPALLSLFGIGIERQGISERSTQVEEPPPLEVIPKHK